VINAILSLVRALPLIANILQMAKDLWDKWQISKIRAHYERKKSVRDEIIFKMEAIRLKEPFDDKEYARLTRDLAIIDSIY